FSFSVIQPTTTNVVSSSDLSVFGQAVTFTATVSPSGSGGGTPNGSVDFFDTTTSTDLGMVNLASGSASLTTSALAVANPTTPPHYSGGGNFPASSASLTQTVYSAQQQIGATSTQVTSLVTGGALSSGNGNALTAKLNSATANLNSGNTSAGINQL